MAGVTDPAKPPAKRDHLWVLFIIAACALLELVASWVTIGAMSGFPVIGGKHGLPTDWTLAVTSEAYWGYALYSWLAGAPGPRSRSFAMWSAGVVFVLSLIGQGSAHLISPGAKPPPPLVVFVTSMPVLVLALIAILIHLRQLDREEVEAAERARVKVEHDAAVARAEADERTGLRRRLAELTEARNGEVSAIRAEMDDALRDLRAQFDEANAARDADMETLRAELEAAQNAREEAESARAEADAQCAQLARKLDAQNARKKRAGNPRSARTRKVAGDVDARVDALRILDERPDISGAELGLECGMSKRWGQDRKKEYAAMATELNDSTER